MPGSFWAFIFYIFGYTAMQYYRIYIQKAEELPTCLPAKVHAISCT